MDIICYEKGLCCYLCDNKCDDRCKHCDNDEVDNCSGFCNDEVDKVD